MSYALGLNEKWWHKSWQPIKFESLDRLRWRLARTPFFVSFSIALTSVRRSAKRASYNLNSKRAAIAVVEDNGNHSATAEFGLDRGCIIRWRKQQNQILKRTATFKKITGPYKGRLAELEEEVCEFVRNERNRGFAVSANALQAKVMEIARRVEFPRTMFRASYG
ncbi:hypothetical protein MRX96_000803 [Rhipicephalus microplus]